MLGNWNNYDSDWLGCGVYEHGPECLCDVKVTHPTPTVRDCVNDIWMGPQICDIRGYGVPWTSAQLADYLTDLGKFQDALRAHGMSDSIVSEQRYDTSFAGMTSVRKAVSEMLEKMPEPSLPMALQLLGVSPARFLMAVTQAKFPNPSAWTIEKLERFEKDALAHTKVATMTERYDISESNYYRIKQYMHPVFLHRGVAFVESASPEKRAARQLALQMIRDGKENTAIVDAIWNECGVRYSSAAISKMRARNFPKSI